MYQRNKAMLEKKKKKAGDIIYTHNCLRNAMEIKRYLLHQRRQSNIEQF